MWAGQGIAIIGSPTMRNGQRPHGTRVEHVRLTVPSLPPGRPPLRICHLSDLHLRRRSTRQDGLADLVTERAPDLVALTGDVLVREASSARVAAALLPRLRGRLGTFACRGNGEMRRSERLSALRAMMADWGVELLVNESRMVRAESGTVLVGGLDDVSLGWPDSAAALSATEPADCALLLAHAPLAAHLAAAAHLVAGAHRTPAGRPPDVILSGHTHGGQIRVPLLWRAALPPFSAGFAGGLYAMPWGHLYVNRGFGTARTLPVRWHCPAEVAFIDLQGPPGATDASPGARPGNGRPG